MSRARGSPEKGRERIRRPRGREGGGEGGGARLGESVQKDTAYNRVSKGLSGVCWGQPPCAAMSRAPLIVLFNRLK